MSLDYKNANKQNNSSDTSLAIRWKKEYDNKGIPSSFRNEPSGVVKDFFYPFFIQHSAAKRNGKAIDMGCGLGRNSLFLAEHQNFEVVALDLVAENIQHLQKQADARNLKIKAICCDVTDQIPVEDDSIDVIMDIFCYKHQLDERKKENYRKEVARVLKNSGYYLLSLAGKDDGFYGPLLKEGSDLITDPVTNIGSQLYDIEDITQEFNDYKILETQTNRKTDLMHGVEYERVTHGFIMSKCC